MVGQKWGLDGKKIYFLDDKNDCYYHLINTTGEKKKKKAQIENVMPSLKSLSGTPNFPDDLFTIPLAFHV